MRILIISQWFDPEPTFKGLVFAKELENRGCKVDVLTGFPNYPGGCVYPGYRIVPWLKEMKGNISVMRVALFPSHNKSRLGRVLNYLSFSISSALASLVVKRPDIVYVYHPPITVGLSLLIMRLRGVPTVLDIQDLWPDTLPATGMVNNKLVLNIIRVVCGLVYTYSNQIVVLSDGFKNALTCRGVNPDKIEVIHNWCDESALETGDGKVDVLERDILNNNFNILFAGNLGNAQGLDTILDAAKIIRTTPNKIRIVFVGSGVDEDRLRRRVENEKIDNVIFLRRRSQSAMGSLYRIADGLIVHLRENPLFDITVPSKIQAYLAAGRPIIAAVRGDARDLVLRAQAGITCEPNDPEGLAAAIWRLAEISSDERNRMGNNGKIFYRKYLCLGEGVSKFEKIFRRLARNK